MTITIDINQWFVPVGILVCIGVILFLSYIDKQKKK